MDTLRAEAGRRDTSRPPIRIVPSLGSSRPATRRSVVVLPQPDGPSRVTRLPASTVNETASTAITPP